MVRLGTRGSWSCLLTGALFALTTAALTSCSAGGKAGEVRPESSTLGVEGNETVFRIQGPLGGPFPEGTRTYRLENLTNGTLHWTAHSPEKWLSYSDDAGDLDPGEEASILVSIDTEKASKLNPGVYAAAIRFRSHKDSAAGAETLAQFELTVREGGLGFEVSPSGPLRAFLTAGDSIVEPASAQYQIINATPQDVAWTADVVGLGGQSEWLFVTGAESGSLLEGQNATIGLSIDSFIAAGLAEGRHFAEVVISVDGEEDVAPLASIPVELQVGADAVTSGWTEFTPAADTRIVYVSSTDGSNGNDGFSPQTAKRTVAAGMSLIRHQSADWLLLKSGDVFDERIGQWKKSGRSETERVLISSYSEDGVGRGERPLLRTGSDGAFGTSGGGGSPSRIDHVAIVGLHFLAHTYTGEGEPPGLSLHQPGRDYLIEDCAFERYSTGLVIQGIGGRIEDFKIRRTLVADCFNTSGGNPQGIYIVFADGVLIEECVFDTNGWQPGVPGAGADIFSHNIYIAQDNSDVVLRDCLIVGGASHGAQMRSGGLAEGNVFLRNTISLMMAGMAGPEQNTSVARDNVILDGRNIDAENERGWGIDFNNIVAGEIRGNVLANNTDGTFPVAMVIDGDGHGTHVHDVSVTDNVIYNWGGSVSFQGNAERLSGITFARNEIQNGTTDDMLVVQTSADSTGQIQSSQNRFFTAQCDPSAQTMIGGDTLSIDEWRTQMGDMTTSEEAIVYPEPTRSAGTYNASLGGAGTHDAFMAQVRTQSRANWREDYSPKALAAYIRAGFGLGE